MNNRRVDAGVRKGGEFTTHDRTESDTNLTTGDPYIILEGGIVQNSPRLDVIDLDILDADIIDGLAIQEVIAAREVAASHGLEGATEMFTEWRILSGYLTEDDNIDVAPWINDQGYILLEGGVIQNNPGLDIIDTGFLRGVGIADLEHARQMRELAVDYDLAGTIQQIDTWISLGETRTAL